MRSMSIASLDAISRLFLEGVEVVGLAETRRFTICFESMLSGPTLPRPVLSCVKDVRRFLPEPPHWTFPQSQSLFESPEQMKLTSQDLAHNTPRTRGVRCRHGKSGPPIWGRRNDVSIVQRQRHMFQTISSISETRGQTTLQEQIGVSVKRCLDSGWFVAGLSQTMSIRWQKGTTFVVTVRWWFSHSP